MDINSNEVYSEIRSILGGSNPKKGAFYEDLVTNLAKISKSEFCGIYFLDLVSLNQKALFFDGKISKSQYQQYFNEDVIEDIQQNSSKTIELLGKDFFKKTFIGLHLKNILIIKLSIKGSFFGFVVFASNEKYTKETIGALNTLTCAYSYSIKDNELSDVFKIQLAALQDAVIEKENAKKTIEKQHKKLLELDKIKNSFLANISHELRTPLNAIIGFSQALDCRIFGELNDKQSEYIKDIHTSSLHLLNMINEILDISKIESKAMKLNLIELSPEILINEVIAILSPLSNKKSIQVHFENGCKGHIRADYQKFQQILYNLLSNAIKFTNNDGEIVVRTALKGKKFILEVQDNGVGIEKKYHNKIFTKFVHLNNIYTKNESSTGLGLTITRELVKLHKGKITLKSELNKGTIFRVEWDESVK